MLFTYTILSCFTSFCKLPLDSLFLSALLPLSLGFSRKYQYVNLLKTWKEAQSYCRENFADMATIETVEDGASVRKILLQSTYTWTWIGLYLDLRGWKWSDQSKASFRMWMSGEPNGGAGEPCAVGSVNGWNDVRCIDKRPFICSG
uniref:C-type lectin domain-containing protein n=1 Tax=Sander lucioperca TaxID=283035 RepID=A0A8C9YQZ5_SANLU